MQHMQYCSEDEVMTDSGKYAGSRRQEVKGGCLLMFADCVQ